MSQLPTLPDTWQVTLGLPATAAGTIYWVTITATANNVSVNLRLSLHAVDTTPPVFVAAGTDIPDNVLLGGTPTPTVTVQATDKSPGAVFSSLDGTGPTGATVQFDGQQVPVTQTVTGDPASWTATLPQVTLPSAGQAAHQVTVTVKDAAGNPATMTQQMWLKLESWTRLEPSPATPP